MHLDAMEKPSSSENNNNLQVIPMETSPATHSMTVDSLVNHFKKKARINEGEDSHFSSPHCEFKKKQKSRTQNLRKTVLKVLYLESQEGTAKTARRKLNFDDSQS